MTAGMTGETAIPTGAIPAGFFVARGALHMVFLKQKSR